MNEPKAIGLTGLLDDGHQRWVPACRRQGGGLGLVGFGGHGRKVGFDVRNCSCVENWYRTPCCSQRSLAASGLSPTNESMKATITLPNRTGTGENEAIETSHHLVIIGANGSGKTRLGTWLERTLGTQGHRIAAQRALAIADYAKMLTLEQADSILRFGNAENKGNKTAYRWGGKPETHMLNDYDMLLSVLFARSAKRDADHTQATRTTGAFVPVPDSPIDTICSVWSDIMPHRAIEFIDGKVLVRKTGEPQYHGKEMSDGERVALYLMGQCVCVPDGSIVIIDEPEIHLHKSLMGRLWDKIEALCPEKTFVYITHDLDFAASRKAAPKVWVKSYENGAWVWDMVPEVDHIPENVTIEIVGNRKNVLFTEGEKGGYDSVLYQAAFPDYHVIPRGGCSKVIEATKAMRNTPALHHLQAFGIVDADYRAQAEIDALKTSGVQTIEVAEVENLLCVEPLLRIVATNQVLNPDEMVARATAFIADELRKELELQACNHAEREIRHRLGMYTKSDHTEQALKDAFTTTTGAIDIATIYASSKKLFQAALDSGKLMEMLQVYNRKSLPDRISSVFGLKNGEYPGIILRLLKSERKSEIVNAITPHMPTLT